MSVQAACPALAGRHVELFGSGGHEHPDDLALIARHLGGLGPALDAGCGPGP